MQRITSTSFTGGIQEAYAPDDFSSNQWAKLKGIVPKDATRFETQWGLQEVGPAALNWHEAVIPTLEYSVFSGVITIILSKLHGYEVGDTVFVAPTLDFTGGYFTITEISPDQNGYGFSAVTTLPDATGVTLDSTAERLNTAEVMSVYPIQYPSIDHQNSVFLVALKEDGTIWWKRTLQNAAWEDRDTSDWQHISFASNPGYLGTSTVKDNQPPILLERNRDYRFITGLPFQVYKYGKSPVDGHANNFQYDTVPDSTSYEDSGDPDTPHLGGTPRSIVSAVLLHSRRYYANNSGTTNLTRTDSTGVPYTVNPRTQTAVVVYVDPLGNAGSGTVQALTFPNIRRWPMYQSTSGDAFNAANYSVVKPWVMQSTPTHVQSGSYPFITNYPFPATGSINTVVGGVSKSAYPKPENTFHPYLFLDNNGVQTPGRGFIPRSYVGTMWENLLILGDIEWRADSSAASTLRDGKVTATSNYAVMGNQYAEFGLRDGNTAPHRGSFYYSVGDIDEFDPNNVIRVSNSNARIAGMHVLNNRLICITSAGGESDGVIAYTGNLGAINPYTPGVANNPFAIRKQVIRGGVGVADYSDADLAASYPGQIVQSCVWSEAGVVVFIDHLGGVFYTDGQSCDRLDRFGPKQPSGSSYKDSVAAVGKHLVMWRDGRMLVFTVLDSNGGLGSGCWTELVIPENFGEIKSMYGSGDELYFVANKIANELTEGDPTTIQYSSQVYKFSINGSIDEKGLWFTTNLPSWVPPGPGGVRSYNLPITVATATQGSPTNHVRVNWHRVGITFYKEGNISTLLTELTVKGAPALEDYALISLPGGGTKPKFPQYQQVFSPQRQYQEGIHTVEFPAGIGTTIAISAEWTFLGYVRLESTALWYTGTSMSRGEK